MSTYPHTPRFDYWTEEQRQAFDAAFDARYAELGGDGTAIDDDGYAFDEAQRAGYAAVEGTTADDARA